MDSEVKPRLSEGSVGEQRVHSLQILVEHFKADAFLDWKF